MANFSLQIEPTNDNVFKSLKNNTLGNNSWINKCLNVLLKMDNSIIAFDADWGNGKTFLAKQFQMIINEKWDMLFNQRSDSEFNNIIELNFKNIIDDSYYAIYYNAWEYDNENDPIASFLYYLLKILKKKIQSESLNNVMTNFVKNVIEKISFGWIKVSEEGEENTIEKVLSSVIETETIREEIKKLLNELREEKFNKLIIFIDELDRCRPTYALKIIEMIKHYLKMENILIVCMTDIKQLSNCIKSVYGNDYNSSMYLDKIFDYKFNLPCAKYDLKLYVNMKLNTYVQDNYFFDMTCMEVIKYFNLSLRNVDKYLSYIGKMFEITKNGGNNDFTSRGFVIYLFMPYYVAALLFKQELHDNFMKGDLSQYIQFCKRDNVLHRVKQIYSISLKNEYDESKLFDYLTQDCTLMVKQINGEKSQEEKYIIDKGSWMYGVNSYLKNIDLLDFFIINTKENN